MREIMRFAFVGVLLAVVALAGCGGSTVPTVTPSTQPAIVDPPGLYEASGGKVRAVGILGYVDLEGGFWAVTGVAATDTAEGTVVAVIANAEAVESQLMPLRGHYVEVVGTQSDGASVRMAGPEIMADEIRVLEGVVEEGVE